MYTAPEVINGIKYDNRCDVWSLGIMVFMMLTGRPPFSGQSKDQIYRASLYREPDYSLLSKYYQNGKLATDFIKQCLIKDHKKRISIEKLVNHEWLKTMVDSHEVEDLELVQLAVNLNKFKRANVFQSSIIGFMTGLFHKKEDL